MTPVSNRVQKSIKAGWVHWLKYTPVSHVNRRTCNLSLKNKSVPFLCNKENCTCNAGFWTAWKDVQLCLILSVITGNQNQEWREWCKEQCVLLNVISQPKEKNLKIYYECTLFQNSVNTEIVTVVDLIWCEKIFYVSIICSFYQLRFSINVHLRQTHNLVNGTWHSPSVK